MWVAVAISARSLAHLLPIVLVDFFGVGHGLGNVLRHANLVDAEVRIGGDDGSGRVVDTLPGQISAEAAAAPSEEGAKTSLSG